MCQKFKIIFILICTHFSNILTKILNLFSGDFNLQHILQIFNFKEVLKKYIGKLQKENNFVIYKLNQNICNCDGYINEITFRLHWKYIFILKYPCIHKTLHLVRSTFRQQHLFFFLWQQYTMPLLDIVYTYLENMIYCNITFNKLL